MGYAVSFVTRQLLPALDRLIEDIDPAIRQKTDDADSEGEKRRDENRRRLEILQNIRAALREARAYAAVYAPK